MQHESQNKKYTMAISTTLQFIGFTGLTGLQFVFYKNAHDINKEFSDFCDDQRVSIGEQCDTIAYDTNFEWGPFHQIGNTDLLDDYAEHCDDDCLKTGNRWTIVYKFSAVLFLLFVLNSVMLFSGTFYFRARCIGNCMFCLLNCTNIAAIVTTAVLRFNMVGRVSAISKAPSSYDGQLTLNKLTFEQNSWVSDKRTYTDDG